MLDEKFILRALDLIDEGRNDHARVLIKQALESNPNNSQAWALLVQVAESQEEKVNAARQVLRLKPDDEMAQQYVTSMVDQEALRRVVDLIKLDRKKQANFLLEQVLERNQDDPDAWTLKARVAENREEAIHALEQVLRLNPDDEQAEQYLTRLHSELAQKGTQPEKVTETEEEKQDEGAVELFGQRLSQGAVIGIIGAILLLFTVCLVVVVPLLSGEEELESISCEEIIDLALQVSDEGCETIGSNQVCYGNEKITADLSLEYEGRFNIVGDTIPIEGLQVLSASPLDMENNFWGVAVMKLKANLPGTVPGQNVTFMVFGDTEVDNDSGDMSAFYFSTGFSGITCSEVPFDGLLIEMDEGVGIRFQANGVDFLLEGDAVLQAKPGEEMTVSMIDGTGKVYANGQERELSPGTYVEVPMDEDLNPTGPPTEPQPLGEVDITMGCQLLGIGCPEETAVAGLPSTWTPKPFGLSTYTSEPIDPSIPTYTPKPVGPGTPVNTSVPLPTNTSKPRPPTSPPGGPTDPPPPTSPPGGPTDPPPPTDPPSPTDPPPPTNTPIPISCSSISVSPGSSGWIFRITNNNSSPIVITQVYLAWPDGVNGAWGKTWVEGKNIHSIPNSSSPATMVSTSNIGWRTIPGGATWIMEFGFTNDPAASGYNVTVTFDVGCPKSSSQ